MKPLIIRKEAMDFVTIVIIQDIRRIMGRQDFGWSCCGKFDCLFKFVKPPPIWMGRGHIHGGSLKT
ncbi:hypothetical protein NPIL_411941, partial [Nephila pilipes]